MSGLPQAAHDGLGIGSVLEGRFRLDATLGGGAMGEVFRANQLSLDRPVAVKVLRPAAGDAASRRRFEDEAKILSRLDHPGIVRILDFGVEGDRPFLVMDLVEGQSLERMLAGGAGLAPKEAVDLLVQICGALGHAHAAGVIHRDLKPENVIVTGEGKARVVDFGIARLTGPDAQTRPALTTAGMVVGTPEYVSPEQAMAEPLDARSDLYSLGVVAYRMLCGELPFSGGTPGELLARHTQDTVPPLAERVPESARPLTEVVHRLLSKRPADRFATADAAADAFRDALVEPGRTGPGGATLMQPHAKAGRPVDAGGPVRPTARAGGSTRSTAVKTANLTVLFASMDDFAKRTTRLSYEEQAALAAVFEALTVPVAQRYGGRKVKTIQESQLFTFPSPTAAMKAAAAMQDRAGRYNRNTPESLTVRLRIGGASGEVRLSNEDVFGEPVNLAARVKALAGAGEVLLTGGIHLSMNRAEVRSDPLGRRTFKGIPEPVDVHRLVRWPGAADAYGGDALDALRLPALDAGDAHALASGRLAWRMHRVMRVFGRRRSRGGDGVVTGGAVPEGAVSEGAVPEGAGPEGAGPEGAGPEGAVSEGAGPEGAGPEGAGPEGAVPENGMPSRSTPSADGAVMVGPAPAEGAVADAVPTASDRAVVHRVGDRARVAAGRAKAMASAGTAFVHRHARVLGFAGGVLALAVVLVLSLRGLAGWMGGSAEALDAETARASLPELEARLREDPDDLSARAALAHALVQAGRGEAAVGHYLRIANADPGLLERVHLEDLVGLLAVFGEATGDVESALIKVGRPAIRPLRAVWDDESAGRYLRRRAGQVLVAMGQDVDLVPIWIATLDSDQCGAQQLAARELARIGDARAVAPLQAATRRGCLAGRSAARQALTTLNP